MAVSENVAVNLAALRARIAAACDEAGRDPSTITLLAVSKGHSTDKVRAAYDLGLRDFGENYAQELSRKAEALRDLEGLRWRFIGHLQRNKIKLVVGARASVDTVDTVRLAEALARNAVSRATKTEVMIQVNVGREPQKSGCSPEEVPGLVEAIRAMPSLVLAGIMAVAPHDDDPNDARPYFDTVGELAESHGLAERSMGMTHDLEPAVAAGATMLRIGTALFGPRPR
ncbi:MAG: YggS family pyridoxal phosphate-dependent enzyme [Myxococcota bacterium]